jgi:hypothetical protein
MMIVPEGESLVVEVKISPQDIDQVNVGQKAALRLTAFNQRTTPVIDGKVAGCLSRARDGSPLARMACSAQPDQNRAWIALARSKIGKVRPKESMVVLATWRDVDLSIGHFRPCGDGHSKTN